MKYIILLTLLTGLFSQDFKGRGDDEYDAAINQKRKDRMEMMIVWRLTDELELTTEQAEKFFPRFRKHRDELEELKAQERSLGKDMKQKLEGGSKFSKNDVQATIKKVSELRKRHIELESQFVLGVDDILNAEQLATLGFLKHKMLRDVKDELGNRSKKNNRKNKIKKRGGRKSRGF